MHGFVLIGSLLSYTLCSHEKANFDLGNIRTKSLTTAKKSTLKSVKLQTFGWEML